MPTSPNSLTITATRRPCSAVRIRLSNVVLPEPRKPVRIMTEALGSALIASKVGCCLMGCSAIGLCLSPTVRENIDRFKLSHGVAACGPLSFEREQNLGGFGLTNLPG